MGPMRSELVDVWLRSNGLGAAMVSSRLGGWIVACSVIAEDGWEAQPEDDSDDKHKGIRSRPEGSWGYLVSWWANWVSCPDELRSIRGLVSGISWYALPENRDGNSQEEIGSLGLESVTRTAVLLLPTCKKPKKKAFSWLLHMGWEMMVWNQYNYYHIKETGSPLLFVEAVVS